MSSLECGGIIGSGTGYGNDLVVCLECFYKAFLIHRAGTGDDFQFTNALFKLLVGKLSKLRTGDDVAISVCRIIP